MPLKFASCHGPCNKSAPARSIADASPKVSGIPDQAVLLDVDDRRVDCVDGFDSPAVSQGGLNYGVVVLDASLVDDPVDKPFEVVADRFVVCLLCRGVGSSTVVGAVGGARLGPQDVTC